MAIRLHDNRLETPATTILNGARKFFVSCRLRIAAESSTANGGSVVSRSLGTTFTFDIQAGEVSGGRRTARLRLLFGNWGPVAVTIAPGVSNHLALIYDAADAASQGVYANGIFKATATPASIAVPDSSAGFRIQGGSSTDYAVEELVIGVGVIPTAEQLRDLGELTEDGPTPRVIADLIGEGGTVYRWRLRGAEGAPAGGERDAGTTALGSSPLKFGVSTGSAVYLADMDPAAPVVFGEPTIMSSGRAVNIPLLLATDAGLIPTSPLSNDPLIKPTFRVNGGSPIAALEVVGEGENYDGLLCRLPVGTAIGPDDVVTWSVAAGWVSTASGASDIVADEPCRNRVGKTSYSPPEDQPPMRVGLNFTMPGPGYYASYRLHENLALATNAGGAGSTPANRRDGGRGTLNTPSSGIIVLDVGTDDKVGLPLQTGLYYLAWTDHGEAPGSPDAPCNFSPNSQGYNPRVTLLSSRDETLPDGSVRKARVYEVARHRSDITLAGDIDAVATTIPISDFGTIGAPGSKHDIILEVGGETITASGRIANPPQLTNCVRGVKGTSSSHASGSPAVLSTTQWGGTLTMHLTGTTGKVNYSDLVLLGPEDWTPPANGEPTPILYSAPFNFSAEAKRWTDEGLGILRFMDSTPFGPSTFEPEHIHDPTDAMWGLQLDEAVAVITSVRQFTGGADKWSYIRHESPGSQTYPVTLLEPLGAVAAGTKQAIEVEGSESNPVMIGSRLLAGDEVIRVISGSGTTWLVERGAALTTPEAHEAGEISAGWRLPLVDVAVEVDPGEGGGGDVDEEGPGGEGSGEGEGEEESGGETGGAIDVPSGPIYFEFVTTDPHNLAIAHMFDATTGFSSRPDLNIQARRTGTLTADLEADSTTIHVAFAEEDWPWVAPGLQMLIDNEVMIIDTVDKANGVVTLEIPTTPAGHPNPPRTNAAFRASGTTVTTRSNRLLCESADGAHRAWQHVLNYSYRQNVTGPNTIFVNREPSVRRSCVKVVAGQTLDDFTQRIALPTRSFPYEFCVKLAERARGWMILNVPGYATDDYVVEEARRVLAASTPGAVKFAVEFANEIWNWSYPYFDTYAWLAALGGAGNGRDYAVRRSWRVFDLFKRVFDEVGRGDELIHYMPWQAGSSNALLNSAKAADVPIHATGCGPYVAPRITDDLIAWINAEPDDAPICDAWVFAMARYVGPGSLRVKLENDAKNVAAYEADQERPVKVIHYEGGLARTIPDDKRIASSLARNRDVRYHPNWWFAERDFHSLIARFSRADAIAVFNNAQPPYMPAGANRATESLWGMNTWWGQKPGYGDGRDGGIDNRLNMRRPGLPNSVGVGDNADVKESVRWQATIDHNREFFARNDDEEGEGEDPGGEEPGGEGGEGGEQGGAARVGRARKYVPRRGPRYFRVA